MEKEFNLVQLCMRDAKKETGKFLNYEAIVHICRNYAEQKGFIKSDGVYSASYISSLRDKLKLAHTGNQQAEWDLQEVLETIYPSFKLPKMPAERYEYYEKLIIQMEESGK